MMYGYPLRRLIDRLAVRSRDDDPKAFLTKRLGQPQSLAWRIFSALNDPVTPSTWIARTAYPIPAFPKPLPRE
jgi:hypothetical protein